MIQIIRKHNMNNMNSNIVMLLSIVIQIPVYVKKKHSFRESLGDMTRHDMIPAHVKSNNTCMGIHQRGGAVGGGCSGRG